MYKSIATSMVTQPSVKKEPPEGDMVSAPGPTDSTGMCNGWVYLTLFDVYLYHK